MTWGRDKDEGMNKKKKISHFETVYTFQLLLHIPRTMAQSAEELSLFLPTVNVLWLQGVINANDCKEIKKILLNPAFHHLISESFLTFIHSLNGSTADDADEVKGNDDTDADIKEREEDLQENSVDVLQQIRSLQRSMRPAIQRAIQLSYSQNDSKEDDISVHSLLTKLVDSNLNVDVMHLLEDSILSMDCPESISSLSTIPIVDGHGDTLSISLSDCHSLLESKPVSKPKSKVLCSLENGVESQVSMYEECLQSLSDEISIIESIFSTEHDRIHVHTETLPIVIELCLSSTNKIANLYCTFLCPLDYPSKSGIKCAVHFCGPSTFASSNEVWNELNVALQAMSTQSIGESHLFDLLQTAKEWIEAKEQRFNALQKECEFMDKNTYYELRCAMGLQKEDKYSHHDPLSSFKLIRKEKEQNPMDISNDSSNGKITTISPKKEYIWYWKDANNNWIQYPTNIQRKMGSLQIGKGNISFSHCGSDYTLTKMSEAKGIQIDVQTGYSKEVRRKMKRKQMRKRAVRTHSSVNTAEESGYLTKRAPTKKERRRQREEGTAKKRKRRVLSTFEVDDEDWQRQQAQREEERKKQREKLEAEQLATQCYSPWEIDETITALIISSALKWKCTKSEAKQKLASSLWASDESIDDQLQRVRKLKRLKSQDTSTGFDAVDLYDITLNTLAPTKSDVEQGIELQLPERIPFECPVCIEEKSIFGGIRIHCGHTICISCLSDYIFNQIDNGVTTIKCPQFKCKQLIDDSILHVLSDVVAYGRYRQFLQNSFLETSSDWKFCPNPKCNSAIKCKQDVHLVVCNCSTLSLQISLYSLS